MRQMAKIRHIAVKVEDQEKTAEFYKQTFGMTEAWRGPVRGDGKRAIYLTDGYINMAVLPARGGREGIDHFGFQVEDMEATLKTAAAAGAHGDAAKKPRDGRFPRWAFRIRRDSLWMSLCTGGRRRCRANSSSRWLIADSRQLGAWGAEQENQGATGGCPANS